MTPGSLSAGLLALAAATAVSAAPGGEALFQDRCAMCHSGDPMSQGPPLAGVVGRKAGAAPGFAYSAALKNSGLVWTRASLDRFLADPGKAVPGTAMPVHVADPATRAAIIDYLAKGR